jgi:molybdenum cofactor synthesis domain-containing protein
MMNVMQNKTPTAGVIIIGNEILSGRTQDLNLAYIATKLGEYGVQVTEAKFIADVESIIIKTVLEYSKSYDYVFTTGGLGPTHDDITTSSIAKAFDVPLETNEDVLRAIEIRCGKLDKNSNSTIMAMFPKGSRLIPEPISGSPGFIIENVHVMAGIPEIMRSMLDYILLSIKQGAPITSQTLCCHLNEGIIAKGLKVIQTKYPLVDIGSYPLWAQGTFGASIVVRGINESIIKEAITEVSEMVIQLGGVPILEAA